MGARAPGRRGIVLLPVLLIIALLAVVLLQFGQEARVNWQAAWNFRASEQALYSAEAGVSVAVAALHDLDLAETREDLDALFGDAVLTVGEGRCTVSVEEENGLINVNMLKDAQGTVVRERADQMLKLLDLLNAQYPSQAPYSYGIVPAMMDWVDADDEVTYLPFVQYQNEGAERAYYEGLDMPRGCKNAPMDVPSELALVKGVGPELFAPAPGARPSDRQQTGLEPYVTVWGDGLVDLNHAPALVLQSLSEDLDEAMASAIIARRATEPFRSVSEVAAMVGLGSQEERLSQVAIVFPAERYFRVTSTGKVGGLSRTLEAVIRVREGGAAEVMRREPTRPTARAEEH